MPATPSAAPTTPPDSFVAPPRTEAVTTAPTPPPAPWPPTPPAAASDFCIEGIDALDANSCYVLPAAPTDELLIYLHGIVPPTKNSRQKTNFENVVRSATRRAGVAALLPRGRVGLAPRGHDGWWGWPTSRATYQALASELVTEILAKKAALEHVIGRPFRRTYLAGSSSGAYFVQALALRGALPADGYGIISGAAETSRDLAALPQAPFYIGFGTRDTVGAAARSLGAELERAGATVQVSAHPLPHGAAEIYLDEAFALFRKASP